MARTELRYFQSSVDCIEVTCSKDAYMPRDMDTCIYFFHLKMTGYRWIEVETDTVCGPEQLVGHEKAFVVTSDVKRFSERHRYTKLMAEKLSSVHVPEDEQEAVIEKIFKAVEERGCPGHYILVCVLDTTLRFLDNIGSSLPRGLLHERVLYPPQLVIGDEQYPRIARYSSRYIYKPWLIPATRSVIEGLENVRYDSLETSVRKMPCGVCREDLDHFAITEGTDQHMITRLPCLHLYHEDCIALWLDKNHMCPVCRYPMPTVSVEQKAQVDEPPGPWHWTSMLKVAANGILTAAACVGLRMIESKLKHKILNM